MKAILALFIRHLKAFFSASPSAATPQRSTARATQVEALEPRILFSGAQADLPEEPHSGEEPPAEVAFAESLGGAEGKGNAVDGSGNVYVVGSFQGTIDADPSGGEVTLASNGGQDVYLSKFDNAGNLQWSQSFGGSSSDYGNDIDVDASGNVYVTGTFRDTVDFDPDPSGDFSLSTTGPFGNADAFITKFDTDGNFLWAKSFGGAEGDYGLGIDVDGSGSVYVTGEFGDIASDASGNHVVVSAGLSDAFITKLDTDGNFEWATSFGGSDWDWGNDIAVDGSGNAYVIGNMESASATDPCGNVLVSNHGGFNGSDDIFVTKVDASGQFQWANAFGGSGWDYGNGIDVDGTGNVFITGNFYGTASFDSDPSGGDFELVSNGFYGSDVFVAKLNTDGDTQWAQSFGAGGYWSNDSGNGIDVDAAGHVYVTGTFYGNAGPVDFDADPSGEYLLDGIDGNYDIFVTKLDTDGNLQWAVEAGDSGYSNNIGNELAVDGSGNVFVVGQFYGGSYGGADFDPSDGELLVNSAYGNTDGFLWKLTQGEGDTPPPPPPNTVFVDENDRLIVNSDDDGDTISIKIVGGNVVVSTTDDSVEGGNGTNTNATTGDVLVPVAGLTGITLTTGGGDDKITIGALGNLTGNLTIDGGEGLDTITIQGNTTVTGDVDLDAEEVNLSKGTLDAGGDVAITGNGTASGEAKSGLNLADFEITADGDITLIGVGGSGNGGTGGGNVGVKLTTLSGVTAGGNVTVIGTGGNSTDGTNHGVALYSKASFATTGTGTITIMGFAGTGGTNNDGVYFSGGSNASVADGDLTIEGTAGASGNNSDGVQFEAGSFLTATGLGSISLAGTGVGGGAGTSNNFGVIVKSTPVTTNSGNITVSGTGGAGKSTNIGVDINGNTSLSTNGGSIDIDGVSLGGVGNGTDNMGVRINTGTKVLVQGTGSTGTVTIDGTGGSAGATNNNHGVLLNSTEVKSVNGDLTINGTAGGSGNTNRGVSVQVSTVETTGTGAVSITGTGTQNTSTGNNNDGVYINTGAGKSVKTAGGNLTITGNGGKGATTNHGVRIVTATVNAGTGFLNILGTASAATTGNSNVGVHISGATTAISGAAGSLISGTGGGLTAASGTLNHGVDIAVGIATILPNGEVEGSAGFGATSKARVGKYTP